MQLCDREVIREVLTRHGFHFSKTLGQNFLTEQWVPERIADECGADKKSGAVEIGPGMGCLTQELSRRAQKVCAIELDKALFPVLEETLADCDNVEIIQGDVLKVDFSQLIREKFGDMPVHACANLPYYITSPAISALLDSKAFSSVTVMVQKEVAERICSSAGSKDYSAFSVYVQYYAKAEILFNVPRSCFVPQPKVDSAVVRITPHKQPPVDAGDEKLFFSIVKAAFGQRRKTLANALTSSFGATFSKDEITHIIEQCGFDARIRGEKLSLEDFALLSGTIYGEKEKKSL